MPERRHLLSAHARHLYLPLPTWMVRYDHHTHASHRLDALPCGLEDKLTSVFPFMFVGKTCQQADPCASNPCANGGQCSAFDSHYICTCPPNFHGQTCRQDVNECAISPSPCRNGGTCINEVGSYFCRCTPEYAGTHCERLYHPCHPSPCRNGGTCLQTSDTTYACTCLSGECAYLCVRFGIIIFGGD